MTIHRLCFSEKTLRFFPGSAADGRFMGDGEWEVYHLTDTRCGDYFPLNIYKSVIMKPKTPIKM